MFEYGLLQDAGKVTAEIAKLHAETEFEKYRIVQDRLYKSDYDLFLEEFENKLEANKHGKEYWWKSENRGPIKAVGSKSLSEAGIIFLALSAMTQACKPENSECPC